MQDALFLLLAACVLLARRLHFPVDVEASLLAGFAALVGFRLALTLDAARPVLAFIARHGAWGLRVVARAYAGELRRWWAGR